MEKLKVLQKRLIELWNTRPIVAWVFLILTTGVIAILTSGQASPRSGSESIARDQIAAEDTADTYIPDGFVLVPIDVINYDALDSVLGRYGVVDLFAATPDSGAPARKVASRIKILRAPRNPSHFAVLAPLAQSPALVRHSGGFFVVVQNPKARGTRFEEGNHSAKSRHSRGSRIHVEMQGD